MAWVVALIASIGMSPAFAQENSLHSADVAFRAKQYERAISKAKQLLDSLVLDTVEEITLAHRILGVSYCELGDQKKAIKHFRTLITFSPNESLGNAEASKPCHSLFGDLKNGKKFTAVPSTTHNSPSEKASASSTSGYAKRFIPFGYGQFQNEQRQKGIAFTSTQAAAVILSATMYGLFRSDRRSDGTFAHPGRASVYRGFFWGSMGVGIASALWGVTDAVVIYRRRMNNASNVRKLSIKGLTLLAEF